MKFLIPIGAGVAAYLAMPYVAGMVYKDSNGGYDPLGWAWKTANGDHRAQWIAAVGAASVAFLFTR